MVMILYSQEDFSPVNHMVRPLFTTKAEPDFLKLSQSTTVSYGMLSVPLYCQISGISVEELVLDKVLIQVRDPDDHDLID